MASDIYQRDSLFYQAMRIGQLEASGMDWRVADEYVKRIRAVSAEQVRQVAQKYLVDEHLTVAILEPLPLPGGRVVKPETGGGHEN
ncbi:MAG: insulinase family protein [Gammaproteobacteria bacterium]|nr:insulinase family protein [Gammaproteobacteria bacterium]